MYLNFAENHFSYKINARWRNTLFIVCAILALCGTIAEVVIYLIDAQKAHFSYRTTNICSDFSICPRR